MILILLTLPFLVLSFLQFGLYNSLIIFLWIIVFILSNLLLRINPHSLKLHIIRILSIIVILFLIFLNNNENIYSLSLLIPFSQDKINFVHEFSIKSINIHKDRKTIFVIRDLTQDIIEFLANLNETDNYWLSLSFYPDLMGYKNDPGIEMTISKPLLINRDSCPFLLTNFIMNRLKIMVDLYNLDGSIIDSNSIIIVQFIEIELN